MDVQLVMVRGHVHDKYGLGLTIFDDVVGWSMVGINITTTTTTTSNNIGTIIVEVFDEKSL